jgi:hypothetical protein
MIIKLALFIYFYYIATTVEVLRAKCAISMRVLHFFNQIDLKLLYIPFCLLNFENIIYRAIYLKILSLAIMVCQFVLIFIEMIVNNDFKFDKTALN